MTFDASRYLDAVTFGWLIAERMGMGVLATPGVCRPDISQPRLA
jgi:hypothetical protein